MASTRRNQVWYADITYYHQQIHRAARQSPNDRYTDSMEQAA